MKLPKTFGDLTVKQFQDCSTILKEEGDQLDKYVKVLSCLSGETEDFIESHTPTQIGKWFQQISFFNNPEVPETWPKRIRVGSRFYMPIVNNEDFKAGALIALNHFETRDNPLDFLNQMLACVYVPMGWDLKPKAYDSKLHTKISKDMLSVKLKDVYGFLMFKKKVSERSWPIIETYMNSANQTIAETIAWLNEENRK